MLEHVGEQNGNVVLILRRVDLDVADGILALYFCHCASHVSHRTFSRTMASLSYEVALFGEFFSQDLKAILNRITLHSESSQPFRSGEIVFEPIDAHSQREIGVEPVLLRAKKDFSEADIPWYVMCQSLVVFYC